MCLGVRVKEAGDGDTRASMVRCTQAGGRLRQRVSLRDAN